MKKIILDKKKIINFIIYFCVLIDFGFFYIKGTEGLVSTALYSALCIIGIIILSFYNNFKLELNNTIKTVIIFMIIMFVCDIVTYLRFDFPLKAILIWVMRRSTLLFSILLGEKIKYDKGTEKFFSVCMLFSFIWEIMGMLENIIYFSSGIHILSGYFKTEYFIRGNYVRVILDFMCIIVFIYNWAKLLKFNASKIEIVYLITTFIYQITIDGTRSKQVALIIVMVSMIFFTPINIGKYRKYLFCILIIIVGGLIVRTSIVSDFIMSFSLNQNNALSLSTSRRMGEWSFYWQSYKENWLWGMGDIVEGFGYDSYFNGGNKGYYVEDVGIIGSMARFGIMAAFLYVYLIIIQIKSLAYLNDKYSEMYSFKIGVLVFTIFSMINLSLLDHQSKLYLSVIITFANLIGDERK